MTADCISSIELARTFLFVPADRPDRFEKARAAGADVVVVDLEDAVAPDRKAIGRQAIADWGASLPAGVAVRINALESPHSEEDIRLLSALHGLCAVMVAKSEDAAALTDLHDRLHGVALLGLVETARGVIDVRRIATCRGICRLVFGHLDYAADLGVPPTGPLMTHARCELVLASRAAGLAPPVDGVTPELDDVAIVRADAREAYALGFGGKLCIHPRQVAPVAEAFRPGEDELLWAGRVLDAATTGASRVGTEMVDGPLIRRARALLRLSDDDG